MQLFTAFLLVLEQVYLSIGVASAEDVSLLVESYKTDLILGYLVVRIVLHTRLTVLLLLVMDHSIPLYGSPSVHLHLYFALDE